MTAPVVRVALAARLDLDAYAKWLGTEVDVDVARRFARLAAETFAKLAAAPGLGSPVNLDGDDVRRVRKWRVQGFPKLLVFYTETLDGVRIARVIHAAQDWATMLDMS